VSNPVDSGGPPSGDPVKGRKILEAIVADPNVAVVICPITGALESMSNQLARTSSRSQDHGQAHLRRVGLPHR
jgi:acetate---CoA ligase (ADP-forming)